MSVPVDPRAAPFLGPVPDFGDQRAGDAPAAFLRRSEQVLEITDVCGRRAGVDEEVHDSNKAPVNAGATSVDLVVLLEAAPRLVIVLLRPARASVKRVVAGEQLFPCGAVSRFEPPDRDHAASR